MVEFEDPLTGTSWLDTSDLPGSAVTSIVGVVALGILFTMIAVSRATVTPVVASVVDMIPGVSTGDAGSDVDYGFGGGGI